WPPALTDPAEKGQRPCIWFSIEEDREASGEWIVTVRHAVEQGHGGAQLHRVDPAENRLGARAGMGEHGLGAFAEPRAERGVGEIGASLLQRGDRVEARRRAHAEAGDLREDEPHPVALLAAV